MANEYCLFTHLLIDYECAPGDTYSSMRLISKTHPLVQFLIKHNISKIALGRSYLVYDEPKECSLLFQKILDFLQCVLSESSTIDAFVGKSIKVVKVVNCETHLMADEHWQEDELDQHISEDTLQDLRSVVKYVEGQVRLDTDEDLLNNLGLTKADLDDPEALAATLN